MTVLPETASVHEKTVQMVAVKDLDLPASRVRVQGRGKGHPITVTRVDRRVWDEVKRIMRPGEYVIIVSEREVWLRNKP